MKTPDSSLLRLGMASLLCCGGLVAMAMAADDASPKTTADTVQTRRPVVYKIPDSCFYDCIDHEEARRRYEATKAASTADVFRLSTVGDRKRLIPVRRLLGISSMGASTPPATHDLGLNVTEEDDKAIREALASGEIFIMHYHFGW